MSFRKKDIVVICPGPDGKCELCGKVDELRPYGPRGENICFDCGMKNEPQTRRQMNHKLFGEPIS